jgi:hypothetical protein
MKTKLMIVAFMMAVSVGLAKAADPIGPKVVVVSQKESGMFKVIYEGGKTGKVNFNIYDAEGSLVFHETISGVNGFVRPVNFNGMSPGEYTIEIADASGKQLQKVTYEVEKPVTNIHVAKIGKEEKYLLAVANRGSEEQMLVKIYDGTNNLVHQETITVKENFGLVYNLKHITGSPVFEISDLKGNRVVKY